MNRNKMKVGSIYRFCFPNSYDRNIYNSHIHLKKWAFYFVLFSEAGGLLGSGAVPSDISRNTGTGRPLKMVRISCLCTEG